MPPRAEDFRQELERTLAAAKALGLSQAGIRAGDLHRRVGGDPGPDHRMPVCCEVMRSAMRAGDEILATPPKGRGASLLMLCRVAGR